MVNFKNECRQKQNSLKDIPIHICDTSFVDSLREIRLIKGKNILKGTSHYLFTL